jgi:glycosyltransferase involved in cell wall biosynthesis
MAATSNHDERSIVVGLSSNVLEPRIAAGRFDGIGTYTLALERALRELGVATRRVGAPIYAGLRLERPRDADLQFPFPLPPSLAAAHVFGTSMPFGRDIEQVIDVYHATDYLVPRLERVPVVSTMYDAIPLAHPEWANQRFRRLKNWLLRQAAQRADCVIAISASAVAELMEHYHIPRERIRVIPLGIETSWFEPVDETGIANTLRRYGLTPGYFLFVGTLQPRKNVGALLRAYDTLPAQLRSQSQLVVVGKYGWGAAEVRSELETRSARGRVVWLDYVDNAALRALYAGAGAFVFPSLAEGFGLPVLEALASGLAVVASDLPALREVAGDYATYAAPNDSEGLASAMQRTIEASVDRIAASARREHARQFSWTKCARKTLEVYSELTRRTRRRGPTCE